MPTENRRIATYLPKEVDEKFQAFKLERGIKGDSHALLTVLSEFLGVAELVAPSMPNQYQELSRQFNDLQTELTSLESRLFSRLKSELLMELPKVLLLVVPESINDLPQSDDLSVIFESGELTCLTGKELAERFGVASDTPNRWRPGKDRAKLPEKLLIDTRKKDPDGIGWSYLSEVDKFQSEKPLPDKSSSELLSELPVFSSFDPDQHF
jgi:hypothetical protein